MIERTYFLLIVFLMTIGTFLIRGSFIFFSSKMNLTPKVRELFTFIPAAIFPALVVPATFFHQGHVELFFGKERFLVLLASTVLCFYIRSTLAVVSFGLIILYAVKLL